MHEPTADEAGTGSAGRAGQTDTWRRWRLLGSALLLLGGALGALVLLPGRHVLWSLSPRRTPALAERWRTDRPADQVLIIDGNVLLIAGNQVELRAGASGRTLWQSAIGSGERSGRELAVRPVVIGNHLFVGIGSGYHLLDRATGALRLSMLHDGVVSDLIGPPLVASIVLETGQVQLMAIDPDTGMDQAQQLVDGPVGRLHVAEGVLVVPLPETGAVLGLEATTLEERWRAAALPAAALFEVDGQLYVDSAADDGGHRAQTLDPRSGQLGAAHVDRPAPRSALPPELALRPLAGGQLVERQPLGAHLAPWSTWVPCQTEVGAVQRGQLVLACTVDAATNYVLKLDWRSGAVERAWYGLAPVRTLLFGADLVLASTTERVVAFAPDQAAVAAENASALDRALDRILAQPIATRIDRVVASIGDDQRAQLEALGEPALTPLLQRLPALGDSAFAVVAQVLARAQARAAGPAIAQRALTLVTSDPTASDPAHQARLDALLRALGRIGGNDGLVAAAAVLNDPRQPVLLRQRALRTLVQLKSADADIAVGLFLERNRPTGRSRWWHPLEHWQQPGSGRAIFALLGRHLDAPDGSHWILLRGGPLGDNGHLWLIQANADGSASDTFGLLGQRCPNHPFGDGIVPGAIGEIRWSGDQLAVHCVGADAPFVVALASALSDRDGDGINDRAEELLHLNPLVADSDLDGAADGDDLTPNGREGEPMLEPDQLVGAIVRDRFGALGSERGGQPTLIVNAGAFNWETAATPLLTYNDEELAYACDVAGCADVPRLIVEPAPDCQVPGVAACIPLQRITAERPLDPDERVVVRRLRGGPPGDDDDAVLLRKVGRFWVVEELVAL